MSAPLTRTQRLAAVLLEAKARHVFVNGDIAQIVVDWSIDGTGPDGEHVHVEGARRGADGRCARLVAPTFTQYSADSRNLVGCNTCGRISEPQH
jgi:hypothetical protein